MNTAICDEPSVSISMIEWRMRMRKMRNRRHHPTPLVSRPIPSTTPAQMISATAKRPTYTRKRTNEPTEMLSKRVVRLLGRRMEGRSLLQSILSSGHAKTAACACIGGARASRLASDHALHNVGMPATGRQLLPSLSFIQAGLPTAWD